MNNQEGKSVQLSLEEFVKSGRPMASKDLMGAIMDRSLPKPGPSLHPDDDYDPRGCLPPPLVPFVNFINKITGSEKYGNAVSALHNIRINGFFGEHAPQTRLGLGVEGPVGIPRTEDLWHLLTYARKFPAGTSDPIAAFVKRYQPEILRAFERKCVEKLYEEKKQPIEKQFKDQARTKIDEKYQAMIDDSNWDRKTTSDPAFLSALETWDKLQKWANDLKIAAWDQSLTEGKKFAAKALLEKNSPFQQTGQERG